MLRLRNARPFFGALLAKFTLVVPLMQIAEVWHDTCALQGLPGAVMRRNLRSIRRQAELRVGAKKGGNLRSLHLIHVVGIGLESGI